MIEVNNLTKIYKLSKKQLKEKKTKEGRKIAVSDVSFKADAGEIFGILGPNGAGKTTTLRCMATLLNPTEGTVMVDGLDVVKDAATVRGKIGFLTNEIKLDEHFSVDYLFDFFGRLHGVEKQELSARKDELFSYFGITEFKDKKIQELSTGMKQKAAIAVCLVHDPEIVIFDEPTAGLDIITARLVTDYLKLLKEQGKTVIISTHIMSEAEKLCDRICVIVDGKKVCEDTLDGILAQYEATDLEDAFFEMYRANHREEI